ncbi:glucodextranase DOMON-like domain-containing protein, partial [candidate division KSB1 bacterium]
YFRILFENMTEPVMYSQNGELFIPGAVIAINKGGSNDRPLGKYGDGVEFGGDGGYDVKINIGDAVSLTNPLGRVYYTTPSIGHEIRNIEKSLIEFSLLVEYLGEPGEDWKYFVGAGLMSDRSMNFANAGPMPVLKEGPPVFIKGANFDFGNPAFIDILLPEDIDQSKLLGNYDPEKGKRAVVPMIGPENKKDSR